MTVSPWRRREPTEIHKIGFRTIITKTFRLPDGSIELFGTYNPEGQIDVATIAVTTRGSVLLFRQFRPGPEIIMDELPGGTAESNESPEAAARRELEEEAGYTPKHMTYLGKLNTNAYSNAWFHYYLATGCEPTAAGQQLEPNEQHGELIEVSIDELISIAQAGHMTDSGAILLAYDTLLKLKEKKKHEPGS